MWKGSLRRKQHLSRQREPHQQVNDCTVLWVSSSDELCNDDRSHTRRKKHFLRQIPRESLNAAWGNISSRHFWSSLNPRELPDISHQTSFSCLNEVKRLLSSRSTPQRWLTRVNHHYLCCLITWGSDQCNQSNSIEVQGEFAKQRRLNQSSLRRTDLGVQISLVMSTCYSVFRRWTSTVNVSIDCSMKTMLNVELHVQRASLLLNYIFCFSFFFARWYVFFLCLSLSLSPSSLCTLIVFSYEHTTRFLLLICPFSFSLLRLFASVSESVRKID